MTLRATILGCGSSAGVPRLVTGWGACDPNNPRNRRRRCSLLVEKIGPGGTTRVLIDTSPDLREQLLDVGIETLDAILFTHAHADHTHGIDDVRPIAMANGRLPAYVDAETSAVLRDKFGYCFETPPGSLYPPLLTERRLEPGTPMTISGAGGDLTALPVLQHHGGSHSIGFRFGPFAYSCDLNGLPDESAAQLGGLSLWILDALRYSKHPSHFSVDEALEWVMRLKPARAVLTNLHTDLDYERLGRELPPHVEPAYDGMVLEFADG